MQNQFKIGEFVTFIHSSSKFLITGFTDNGLAIVLPILLNMDTKLLS